VPCWLGYCGLVLSCGWPRGVLTHLSLLLNVVGFGLGLLQLPVLGCALEQRANILHLCVHLIFLGLLTHLLRLLGQCLLGIRCKPVLVPPGCEGIHRAFHAGPVAGFSRPVFVFSARLLKKNGIGVCLSASCSRFQSA
ncbi:Hypothetical predicted protein, partial [Pelobates cultripes]